MTVKGGVPSPYADTIRRLADARGISMRQLAVEAGLGLDAVRNISRGRAAEPRADTMVKLAEALGVSLDELYGREAPPRATEAPSAPEGFRHIPVLALDIPAADRPLDHPDRATGAYLTLPERWLYAAGMSDPETVFAAFMPKDGWFVADRGEQRLVRTAVYITYDGADFVTARLGRDNQLMTHGGYELARDTHKIVARLIGRLSDP